MKGETDQKAFGLDREITRRDFVKGALIGSGAMLLDMPAPLHSMNVGASTPVSPGDAWTGYAGVGDYAKSNGNTYGVREDAHLIRDNKIDALLPAAIDLEESFDVVVAGGGFSGLSAAREFLRTTREGRSCLVLENHALTGGEAKRNEFLVDGHRVVGPQGSNLVIPPSVTGDWYDQLWNELGIPRNPSFQALTGATKPLRIARENFFPMFGNADQVPSSGYYFDAATFGGKSYWDVDSQRSGFRNTAFSDTVKQDLRRLLIEGTGRNQAGDGWERWLDKMTYVEYLTQVLGVQSETTRLFDPVLCVEGGLGADCVSALFAAKVGQPGFSAGGFPSDLSLYRYKAERPEDLPPYSFPGGNDAVFRLLLKRTLPEAIEGERASRRSMMADFDSTNSIGQAHRSGYASIRLSCMRYTTGSRTTRAV